MKPSYRLIPLAALLALVFLLIDACTKHYFRSNYSEANKMLHETKNIKTKPFLKAHLYNGDIVILRDTWKVDTNSHVLMGKGTHYNFDRELIKNGYLTVPFDSVAIYETNTTLNNAEDKRITALAILTAVNVSMGLLCLSNPKACFGSCPTFYYGEHQNLHSSAAEGFSNAIAPSLEYRDVDALDNIDYTENHFELILKNEALETHCIREIKLLAAQRNAGERVYQSPTEQFYRCRSADPPISAMGPESSILELLSRPDLNERFSLSNPTHLKNREELILEFNTENCNDKMGLILHFRQTLMTTYFIYSAIGYMGDEVGDIFAQIETDPRGLDQFKNGIAEELGGIEVHLWDDEKKQWIYQSELYETGPIAVNKQMVPFNMLKKSGTVRVKLVLNQGLWRIDYAALTEVLGPIEPVVVLPEVVLNKGTEDRKALRQLIDVNELLISMPGSEYTLDFIMPTFDTDYELFLSSKGYYIEWMREHWIQDKDLLKLKKMLTKPEQYLEQEAKAYKEYEALMEPTFWNSRIDTKTFSYE